MRNNSNFRTIGAGIIHGPSFINVYNNPVLNTKRSLSRGGASKRKAKKTQLMNSIAGQDQILKMTDRSLRENETVNSFNKLNNMTP